jgi:hypothetical protein
MIVKRTVTAAPFRTRNDTVVIVIHTLEPHSPLSRNESRTADHDQRDAIYQQVSHGSPLELILWEICKERACACKKPRCEFLD